MRVTSWASMHAFDSALDMVSPMTSVRGGYAYAQVVSCRFDAEADRGVHLLFFIWYGMGQFIDMGVP